MAHLEFAGLAAEAGRPAASLTLPSRKRLELAKSLAMKPKVLLLDEVNAGLNTSEIDHALARIQGRPKQAQLPVPERIGAIQRAAAVAADTHITDIADGPALEGRAEPVRTLCVGHRNRQEQESETSELGCVHGSS